jgi:hypothetical protein
MIHQNGKKENLLSQSDGCVARLDLDMLQDSANKHSFQDSELFSNQYRRCCMKVLLWSRIIW